MKSLRQYGRDYIWGLSEEKSKIKRDLKSYSGMATKDLVQSVDLKLLRKIVIREPLIRKAIFKKNRDTFKNWFAVKDDEGNKAPPDILKIIHAFDKKVLFPRLLFDAGTCANIYGTGFIEKQYQEADGTKSKVDATGKSLIDLEILNPEFILKTRVENKVEYPVYRSVGTTEKLIHPSRLEVIRIDKLPNSYFGISIPYVLWNILKSKMTADVSSGEFVDWASRGMIDVTIADMDDDQEKKAKETLKKHPYYLIHDQDYSLDVKNPTQIDPQPFYDYFYVNIAAALEMPKHMLTGAEMGNVTGTEVGVSAYYSDIENIQRLIFTPVIESIYTELLKSHGKEWTYNVDWNSIFVDELAEAKILQTRSYSAVQAKNAGIVDISEARKILNEGVVDLDIKKIPKVEPSGEKPSDPNIEPQPVIKPQYNPLLEEKAKEMIQRWKDAGIREVREQEKRLKEAKKKKGGKKK